MFAVVFLIIFPIIVLSVYIYLFGINVPYWDEWTILPLLDKFYSSHLTFYDLFMQHNEHRLFFPQMLIVGIASLTHYNLVDEMWVSLVISVVSFLAIAYIYFKDRINITSLILFLPISFLFFGLFQYENILWGYQISIYLCVLGLVASLFFARRSSSIDLNFMMTIFFGVLATFSFFNGLLVWPIVFLYLLINKKFKHTIIWAFFSAASYAFFFYGWVHPMGEPPMSYSLYHPITSLLYVIANIGAPFSIDVKSALLFGMIIILFYVSSFVLATKNKSIEENSLWFSLILFSLGTSVLCMIGRSGYGIGQALSSRYTTFTILGVIGIYLIIVNGYLKRGNRGVYKMSLTILLGVIAIGLIIGNVYGLYEGQKIASSRQDEITLINNYYDLTNSQILTIYPDPSALNSYIAIMEKYNIKYGSNKH